MAKVYENHSANIHVYVYVSSMMKTLDFFRMPIIVVLRHLIHCFHLFPFQLRHQLEERKECNSSDNKEKAETSEIWNN